MRRQVGPVRECLRHPQPGWNRPGDQHSPEFIARNAFVQIGSCQCRHIRLTIANLRRFRIPVDMPNGAESLIRTLVDAGVVTCFTNPGTSEIHFVAALDSVPEMRTVLTLFEGVATGAADGYARMADAPAATLLHLGPGLGNGLANLHNARRAKVPLVNIVGDHATYHAQYDVPLQSDIETDRAQRVGVGANFEERRRAHSRRSRGDHRCHRTPRSGGDADRAS